MLTTSSKCCEPPRQLLLVAVVAMRALVPARRRLSGARGFFVFAFLTDLSGAGICPPVSGQQRRPAYSRPELPLPWADAPLLASHVPRRHGTHPIVIRR